MRQLQSGSRSLVELERLVPLESGLAGEARKNLAPEAALGKRLFEDDRFSSPRGDLLSSCSRCHMTDQDPRGARAYADFFDRSWQPFRSEDPRRQGARNAPTLLDAGLMPRLHYDGEFASLEELIKKTLSGRAMGWLPGEQQAAFAHIRRVVMLDPGSGAEGVTKEAGFTGGGSGLDQGGLHLRRNVQAADYHPISTGPRPATGPNPPDQSSYREQFREVYGADPATIGDARLVDLAASAIASFVRTLRTGRATPYDRFVELNHLELPSGGPGTTQNAISLCDKMLKRVASLESNNQLRLPPRFDLAALKGLEIFFRSDGPGSSGNCSVCHVPPYFTDFSFHNTGVSQNDYERVHGPGSFARFVIPSFGAAARPIAALKEIPSASDPANVDLGYWNFVDVPGSPLRRAGETNDRFLERMVATFKTPTLRDLAYSAPYMHSGAYPTLEDALAEIVSASEMARAGKIRQADQELPRINIERGDIPYLIAFLRTLNDELK